MRVLVPGTFDMLSPKQLFRLSKVREAYPDSLIIACILDLATYEVTMGPVLNKHDEIKNSLEHCKYIDTVLEESPALISTAFVKKHNIDIVVNVEESPAFIDFLKGAYELRVVKEMNSEVCKLASSDDLLVRIISEMDEYIIRNLNRGYQRKELNVSWRKAKFLKFKETFSSFMFCTRRRVKTA